MEFFEYRYEPNTGSDNDDKVREDVANNEMLATKNVIFLY